MRHSSCSAGTHHPQPIGSQNSNWFAGTDSVEMNPEASPFARRGINFKTGEVKRRNRPLQQMGDRAGKTYSLPRQINGFAYGMLPHDPLDRFDRLGHGQ